jgi:hypothetical protein
VLSVLYSLTDSDPVVFLIEYERADDKRILMSNSLYKKQREEKRRKLTLIDLDSFFSSSLKW